MKMQSWLAGVVVVCFGAGYGMAGGFVLVSQPELKPRVQDTHLILHYVDAKTGRIAFVGDLPGIDDHDTVGLFKPDYAGGRLMYATCGDARKESNIRVVEFGQTVKVRELVWPNARLLDTWLQNGDGLAGWAFASDPKPGAPPSAVLQRMDLRTGDVENVKSATPSLMLGGHPLQTSGDGPYLWYTPSRGAHLTDDPETKFGNRPRLTATLVSTPPATLLHGHESSSWYVVGNPAGDFALVEGTGEEKTTPSRLLVYRRGENAWSWTELEGVTSRASLVGRFIVFEEAKAKLVRDERGRSFYDDVVATGRSKIISLDSGDVLEVKMDGGQVMWVDSNQLLMKSGKELWLMTHNVRKITASRLLAKRDSYFDLCLYAFPADAKPTAVQISVPRTPVATGRD